MAKGVLDVSLSGYEFAAESFSWMLMELLRCLIFDCKYKRIKLAFRWKVSEVKERTKKVLPFKITTTTTKDLNLVLLREKQTKEKFRTIEFRFVFSAKTLKKIVGSYFYSFPEQFLSMTKLKSMTFKEEDPIPFPKAVALMSKTILGRSEEKEVKIDLASKCHQCCEPIGSKKFFDERRFCILKNCPCVLCYACIRKLTKSTRVVRGPVTCPICFTRSDTVAASSRWIPSNEKEEFFKVFQNNCSYFPVPREFLKVNEFKERRPAPFSSLSDRSSDMSLKRNIWQSNDIETNIEDTMDDTNGSHPLASEIELKGLNEDIPSPVRSGLIYLNEGRLSSKRPGLIYLNEGCRSSKRPGLIYLNEGYLSLNRSGLKPLNEGCLSSNRYGLKRRIKSNLFRNGKISIEEILSKLDDSYMTKKTGFNGFEHNSSAVVC
ncbi:uncharacterized protein CDAR_110041 [Caerostris darwini]|uniref:RING-type domain-containing protein n=1 Tax=Caerostris darwini TaxID=1538125 RepID=A0AAV4P2D3_9ARAC|nr:uncharacterized protein CDAR_110041 [Caerostris darwini]